MKYDSQSSDVEECKYSKQLLIYRFVIEQCLKRRKDQVGQQTQTKKAPEDPLKTVLG